MKKFILLLACLALLGGCAPVPAAEKTAAPTAEKKVMIVYSDVSNRTFAETVIPERYSGSVTIGEVLRRAMVRHGDPDTLFAVVAFCDLCPPDDKPVSELTKRYKEQKKEYVAMCRAFYQKYSAHVDSFPTGEGAPIHGFANSLMGGPNYAGPEFTDDPDANYPFFDPDCGCEVCAALRDEQMELYRYFYAIDEKYRADQSVGADQARADTTQAMIDYLRGYFPDAATEEYTVTNGAGEYVEKKLLFSATKEQIESIEPLGNDVGFEIWLYLSETFEPVPGARAVAFSASDFPVTDEIPQTVLE